MSVVDITGILKYGTRNPIFMFNISYSLKYNWNSGCHILKNQDKLK